MWKGKQRKMRMLNEIQHILQAPQKILNKNILYKQSDKLQGKDRRNKI